MEKNIPEQVRIIAESEACNRIHFCGVDKGSEVYSISEVNDEGQPIPTGLPVLVLWDGKETTIISGEDSLKLLSRLD
ncbi:MAG: hypothetical protein IKH26_10545 [Bacteroidaceae bacterium]|nr:hypothetical protein [Bacteroidaceae bacterium]